MQVWREVQLVFDRFQLPRGDRARASRHCVRGQVVLFLAQCRAQLGFICYLLCTGTMCGCVLLVAGLALYFGMVREINLACVLRHEWHRWHGFGARPVWRLLCSDED